MKRNVILGIMAAAAIMISAPASAQTQTTAEADPGVRLTRLIDRAEVRVSRLEIEPGAVRRTHAHNDVEYHLWIPIEGSLEITMGSDRPTPAAPGQAFFLKRGTSHGFRNVGATKAAVFEIFIKQTTTAGGGSPIDVLASTLGALPQTSGNLQMQR
jgi:quercetin dioxygenase-like cupin family protein